jgi:hypothetical protein
LQKVFPPLPPPRPAETAPAPQVEAPAPAISPEELAQASAECDQIIASGAFSAVRLPPILDGPDCAVAAPVQVEKINLPDGRQIKLAPPPVLGCVMAAALSAWLRDEGAALLDEGSRRLTALDTAGGYQCRHRNGVDTSKMSEHAKANALDLVGAQWGAARQDFTAPELDLDLATRLQQSLCARFSTVLGPGSDGFHEGHIHIDLEKRHSSGKLCEWDLQ